ncbi:hypothetical protein CYLTODRAFT_490509, partial [Cylindrobasidium torrendii FP15055 ss-10]
MPRPFFNSSSMREIFFDVLSRTGRLEEVEVEGTELDIQKIGQLLLEPTPALRSLSLRVRETSTYAGIYLYSMGLDQTPVKLPAGALMSAPSLHRLSLNSCGIPWLSATFPKMTHLEVADPPETMLEPWPVILDALRSMPLLESLILKSTCVDANAADADASILRLERLAVLKLSCTVTVFSGFFRCLSFPALTRFSLSLDGPDFHPAVAALQAASVHSMDMLDVFKPTLYIKRMNSQHTPAVIIASAPHHTAPFELQLMVTGGDAGIGRSRGYMTMLQTIGHALPLPQVRALHLTTGYEEITGPRFAILNRCVRLHEIHLIGLHAMSHLFNALESVKMVKDPKSGQKKPTIVFPYLQKMVISAADFAGECDADTVRGTLAKRAKMKLPIKELHLDVCSNLSREDVKKMEAYTEVHWDGDEYFDEDEDEDED